jgi:hypothetical protein
LLHLFFKHHQPMEVLQKFRLTAYLVFSRALRG